MKASEVIAEARKKAGWTQQKLAFEIGTSRNTISAYENGHVSPSASVIDRVLEKTDSSLAVSGFRHRAVFVPDRRPKNEILADLDAATVATREANRQKPMNTSLRGFSECVPAITRALDTGNKHAAFRAVVQTISDFRLGHAPEQLLQLDPGSTGSREWDAFVGGVCEMLCHELHQLVPDWASAPRRSLDTWWFFTDGKSLHPYLLVNAPRPLATRGVFVDPNSLRSV